MSCRGRQARLEHRRRRARRGARGRARRGSATSSPSCTAPGDSVVVVTSGAIARGMGVMEMPARARGRSTSCRRPARSARASSTRSTTSCCSARGVPTAQVLLTFFDMSARTHYLNARQTLRKLLEWRVVPGHQRERHDHHRRDLVRQQRLPRRPGRDPARRRAAAAAHRRRRRVHRRPARRPRRRSWSPRSTRFEALEALRDRPRDLAARLGRDALEGGRGRDGDRRRDPDGDRQRPATPARSLAAAAGEAGRARTFPARDGPLLELQAVAEVRQAGARPGAGRRRRGARAARGRDQPAAGRGRRRQRRASTPATRSRSPTTSEPVGKGICNYSAGRAAPRARAEVGRRCASCCRAPARRRSTATTSCSRNAVSAAMATHRRYPSPRSAPPPSAPRARSRRSPSDVKDAALEAIADALDRAHAGDPRGQRARPRGRARGRAQLDALLDRLALDAGADRRRSPPASARSPRCPIPVGEVIDGFRLPNGLDVRKVRVPLGVVAVVYEARPNVTIDAAALCLKSGNAIVLRGSSSGARTRTRCSRRSRPQAASRGRAARGRARRWSPAAAATSSRELATQTGRRRPDHPARRRGAEGGAEGRRDRAGDLRGVGQLPRLRRRSADLERCAGDRAQRQGPAARASATRPRRCSSTPTSPTGSCRARSPRSRDAGVELHGDERARALRRRRAGRAPPPRRTGTPSTWR